MKDLPYAEEIYDLETKQLEDLLQMINQDMMAGPGCELPERFETFEKYEKKALKLREYIELELEERGNVVNFFLQAGALDKEAASYLDDDKFYAQMALGPSTQPSSQQQSLTASESAQPRVDPPHVEIDDANSALKDYNPQQLEPADNFSERIITKEKAADEQSQKSMFGGGRGKMNRKQMQNNMRAMLAKTKVANEVMTTNYTANSGYQVKKNFQAPPKPKVPEKPPATRKANFRKSTSNLAGRTEVVVNSHRSIYKPNIKKIERPSSQSGSTVDSTKPTPSRMSSKPQMATASGEGSKKSFYKPPKIPIFKKRDSQASLKPAAGEAVAVSEAPLSSDPPEKTFKLAFKSGGSQDEAKDPSGELSKEAVLPSTSPSAEPFGEEQKQENPSAAEEIKANEQTNEAKKVESEDEGVVKDNYDDSQLKKAIKDESEEPKEKPSSKAEQKELPQPKKRPRFIEDSDDEGTDYEGNRQDPELDAKENAVENSEPTDLPDEFHNSEVPNPIPKRTESPEETHEAEAENLGNEPDPTQASQPEEIDYSDIIPPLREDPPTHTDDESAEAEQLEMIEKPEVAYDEVEEQATVQEAREPSPEDPLRRKLRQLDALMQEHMNRKVSKEEAQAKQKETFDKIRQEIKEEKEEQVEKARESERKPKATEIVSQQLAREDDKMLREQEKAAAEESAQKKKMLSMQKKRAMARQLQKRKAEDEGIQDYSNLYSSFYDIFVGNQIDPKGFDLNFAVRETRNLFASFVNLLDTKAVAMKQKFKFDRAPTEFTYKDYGIFPNHVLLNMSKNLDDLEKGCQEEGSQIQEQVHLTKEEKKQALLQQAVAQHQVLNERYQAQKGQTMDDIIGAVKGLEEKQSKLVDPMRDPSLYFRVVKTKTEVYDIITRSFSRKKGWSELPHGLDLRNSWNLMWSWSKITIDLSKLLVFQKVNHFTGNKNVSRKDFLKRNIERAQKMSAKANTVFNIMPMTFILPKEYVGFLENFSEFEETEGKLNYWIMKPAAKSRGRGIQVVNDISSVIYGEPMIMQRYLKNPLLINGYKFDLRIYVLVTSVNPLEMFIYKEGFGRFSTVPFTLDPSDKANKYIHLTNVSINKYNLKNCDGTNADQVYGGSKVSLETLKEKIEEAYKVDWKTQIWDQIVDVCLKAMVACQNDMQYNPSCFEVYGFDVIIDSDFKAWLLEINSSPSLSRDTLLDNMIKQRMIDDTMALLDPVDFDRKRMFEVLDRRVHEDFSKSSGSVNTHAKRQMNRDLTYVLNGKVPRQYGELPKKMGNYQRIAPSELSEKYLKLIGGQKLFGSVMKVSHRQEIISDKMKKHNQKR